MRIKIKDEIIYEKDQFNQHTCEFCNTSYPNFDETVVYYCVTVQSKNHIICNECLNHLQRIKYKGETK